MSRLVMIAASLSLFATYPAYAAPAAKAAPFPMAKDGTTNIADCAKADVKFRNECISKSRPVTGAELYAQAAAQKAAQEKTERLAALKAAKAAKAAAAAKIAADKVAAAKAAKAASIPAKVVGAPKGFKISKDGTTNINDCVKAAANVRNECISRARPLNTKQLAKFVASRTAAETAIAAKAAAPAAAKPAVAAKAAAPAIPVAVTAAPTKAATPALAIGKGFKIAKDGTTSIADCASATPEFRNECISRARPVPGSVIYATTPKPKS